MDMKSHILAALREQFDGWQALIASLDESTLSAPLDPSGWTVKDVLAHLWAWQQRTIARVEAAAQNREPRFPNWPSSLPPEDTDQINDWIYSANRARPWHEVHRDWQAGYAKLIDLLSQIPERDMLDGDRFPWLKGNSLALYLLATYDHHQEHSEKLHAWLQEHVKQ